MSMPRHKVAELMDDPALDAQLHGDALRGLRRINHVSNSAGILWGPIARVSHQLGGRPLRVLDVATGAGDVPISLMRRAVAQGVELRIDACDRSDQALGHAREAARSAGAAIRFFTLDALRDEPPPGYDVVTCSLFLHHVDDDQAVPLVARLARAAGKMLLVNDLERGTLGLTLAWLGVRVLSRSRIVHVDGPRSVLAAFTANEMRSMADEAGLIGARVTRRWPCRFLLEWNRP
ncbi:MAG: methyltransferase domain-containing protein [Planctomycetes bacterium]|nr:methyltransferase domain-containing protein [Planctomycetota bacterium]